MGVFFKTKLLSKKQADNRLNKLFREKVFEIHEYSNAKKSTKKSKDFHADLLGDIIDIMWASTYDYDTEYEPKTLQYNTLLDNKIFLKLKPYLNKKEFINYLEQGINFESKLRFGNYKLIIRKQNKQ